MNAAPQALKLSVIAERLVVPVELGSAAASQSVSLLIELDAPTTLSLREDVLRDLKLADAETSLTLSAASGFRSDVSRDQVASYAGPLDLARLSALHSTALEDRPIAGVLGAGFLRNYRVVVDVQPGEMRLLPHPLAGDSEIRIPARFSDGSRGELLIGSSRYETTASAGRAMSGAIEVPTGSSGATFDLTRYVAPRPSGAADDRLIRGGVDLLQHFRIELDWARDEAAFTETRTPPDLTADRAYVHAEATGTAAAFADFLRRHPRSRFQEEASLRLLESLLAENGENAAIVTTARTYFEAAPANVRGEVALALLERLNEQYPQCPLMVLGVAEVAAELAPVDEKSTDRCRIHRLLGTLRLAQGDVPGAWRNLLIAVAGLPDDPQVNLHLARIYEGQGRPARALSRYRLVATGGLSESEAAEVRRALERLPEKQ